MDRYEFMWKLKSLLNELPMQEREEALKYYEDYFEDAGKENEADVIASLGSPEKVAENIKRDAGQNDYLDGYEEPKVERGNEIVEYAPGYHEEGTTAQSKPEKKRSAGKIALIVILCICAAPILLPLGCAAFGILIAVVGVAIAIAVGIIGIVASFGVSTFGLLLGGLLSLVVGIILLPFHAVLGLSLMAAGLLVGVMGIIFLMITVVMGGFVLPKLFQGIGWLFRTLFRRKKNK